MQNKQHKRDQLLWIFNRMCLHYGFAIESKMQERDFFIKSLLCYPEDLICAAYIYLSKFPYPQCFPAPDDFIGFMQPEFERRQQMEACYG
jgi:hypothetical protein